MKALYQEGGESVKEDAQEVGKGSLDSEVVQGFRAIWDGLKKYAASEHCGERLGREIMAWEGPVEVFVSLLEAGV